MKMTWIFIIGILLCSCNMQQKSESIKNDTNEKSSQNFDWLLGNWIRISNDTINKTFENWKKESGTLYFGHGFVMKGTDTIWQEKMVLTKNDSIWTLRVKTAENDNFVEFGLTKCNDNSFTVENPIHDFPKRINYWKAGEILNATVAGDSLKIEFEFRKKSLEKAAVK
ncbi:MAG: DUF6265 family protein [Bacteroidales bacterium]|nr:DUF6265 family protein [Bacteroidales bacterium]